MAFCRNCGAKLDDDAKSCLNCGAAVNAGSGGSFNEKAQETIHNITDTPDMSDDFSSFEREDGKAMGILAYIGILVLLPLFLEKNNRFVRFHVNQGLMLFIIECAYSFVCIIINTVLRVLFAWSPLVVVYVAVRIVLSVLSLVFLAASVMGIINVARGKAKELPIIGKFRILKY